MRVFMPNCEKTQTAIEFMPKIRHGNVHQVIFLTSTKWQQVAKNTRAMPPMKSTIELLHRFWLMGNHKLQMEHGAMQMQP